MARPSSPAAARDDRCPVGRRQFDGAAVHGAGAIDDSVEVEDEVHVDRQLDLRSSASGTTLGRRGLLDPGPRLDHLGRTRPRAGGRFRSLGDHAAVGEEDAAVDGARGAGGRGDVVPPREAEKMPEQRSATVQRTSRRPDDRPVTMERRTRPMTSSAPPMMPPCAKPGKPA